MISVVQLSAIVGGKLTCASTTSSSSIATNRRSLASSGKYFLIIRISLRLRYKARNGAEKMPLRLELTRAPRPDIAHRSKQTLLPAHQTDDRTRSEEHTSELQSRFDLVCRLLL